MRNRLAFLIFGQLMFGSVMIVKAQSINTLKTEQQLETISNSELIKLATHAPFEENFEIQEEYFKAKGLWVAEFPDAYARISERRSVDAVLNSKDGNPNSSSKTDDIPNHLRVPEIRRILPTN